MRQSNTCISHCRGIQLWYYPPLPHSVGCSQLTYLQERNQITLRACVCNLGILKSYFFWSAITHCSPWMTLMLVKATTSAFHTLPISTPHMYHPVSPSFSWFMVTVNTSWTGSSKMLSLSSSGLAEWVSSVRAKLVQNSLLLPLHQYFTWLAYWGS